MNMPDTELNLLAMQQLPREVFVRQEEMPARHFFPAHTHEWHQLLYAISGVLVVTLEGERYFIPPEQAIWLPAGCQHSVYTEFGADLKSLYIDRSYRGLDTPDSVERSQKSTVLHITPLMRELIKEAAGFAVEYSLVGYENDLIQLLLQTLSRLRREEGYLPWPTEKDLFQLCNRLYEQPDDTSSTAVLAQSVSMSQRTLDRKFRKETGMSLKHWRLQLKMLKAIELLNTGQSITSIALDLGYSSPSPFIYMFRERTGISPVQYRKQRETGVSP